MRLRSLLLAGLAAACTPAESDPTPTLTPQASGTEQLLQAVSPVNDSVVWVSGHGGTYARTTNGGATWTSARVPGADTLQFRDVGAISRDTAYLLAAGPADMSRVYKTTDGGASWTLQFQNADPAGFYDCLAFWDGRRGAVYGDALNGQLAILTTADGGETWTRVPPEGLPPARPGEGGFAASGLCLVAGPNGTGWIATGAADTARVLTTRDYGATWSVVATPVPAATAAGLTAISFRDSQHGLVVGGDIGRPDSIGIGVAVTVDGGATWTLAGSPRIAGAYYGGMYVPGATRPVAVAVGPKGADYSLDDGATWMALDSLNYWGLGFASTKAGWLVGTGGRITKVGFE